VSTLSEDLLGAATWSAPVPRPQIREFGNRAKELEEKLQQEMAATQHWYREVERLREELKAATSEHLGD
jgi:hypothetical protein